MAVLAIDIRRKTPYASNEPLGEYGDFERIDGLLHYGVDPCNAANNRIVDIDLAPRDGSGMVRFSGDFTLIAPKSRTPRCLLLEVPNRGNRLSFRMFNRAKMEDLLRDPCAVGDGYLFRHGFALLSVGWQFDASGMALQVPHATLQGCPLEGDVVCQIQPTHTTKSLFVGQLGPVAYQMNEEDSSQARLYVQTHPNATRMEVDPTSWSIGRTNDETPEQSSDHISSREGFLAGKVYTLVYNVSGAPVVGLGLLALRDACAYFRSKKYPGRTAPPPCAIAFGASQTGRVLRHMLYEGLYESEEGELVLDGVMPHIAGAQRGDFNHRFAQPSSIGVPACGQLFPFAGTTTTDAFTGRRDGLFRDRKKLPKICHTNTAWEYWRGDAALGHVATTGDTDIEPVAQERNYFFAGTHHINAVLPISHRLAHSGARARYPLNTVSYTPLIRAVLLNMLEWIEGNSIPPPSQIPKIADGTLVHRKSVIEKFKAAQGFEGLPNTSALPLMKVIDLGPLAFQGICRFPAREIGSYPALVCDVGEDLNEVAGIRLPDIAVPLGIHTGWNLRHPDTGGVGQLATFAGFSVFDKRLVSRTNKSKHFRDVKTVVDNLIDQKFVLKEDQNLLLSGARLRYEIAKQSAV